MTKRNFSLNPFRNIAVYSSLEFDALAELRTTVREFYAAKMPVLEDAYKELEKAAYGGGDDDVYRDARLEALMEQMSPTSRMVELCDELMILGLYKKVELTRSYLLRAENVSTSTIQGVDRAMKCLQVNHESLEGFNAVDELRLLANAIKHQGLVSKDLAERNSHWIKGEKLGGLADSYDRLVADVPIYLRSLDQALRLASRNTNSSD